MGIKFNCVLLVEDHATVQARGTSVVALTMMATSRISMKRNKLYLLKNRPRDSFPTEKISLTNSALYKSEAAYLFSGERSIL